MRANVNQGVCMCS